MWQLPDEAAPDTHFYHATTEAKWLDILQSGGLQAGSFFAVSEIADYYAACIKDDGEKPVVIAVEYRVFQAEKMALDRAGLTEPVCYSAFGLRDTQIYDAWEQSDGSVASCIALIGSFQYHEKITLSQLKTAD